MERLEQGRGDSPLKLWTLPSTPVSSWNLLNQFLFAKLTEKVNSRLRNRTSLSCPKGSHVLGLMKMPLQGRNSHPLLWQPGFLLFLSDSTIPWRAAHHASLSFTISRSLLKLIPIELVMSSNHLSSVTAFSSCLQSSPASGSFPVSGLFVSDACRGHLLQWQSHACSQNSISEATCSLSPDHMGDLIFLKGWPPRGAVQLAYSPSDSSFHRIFQVRILEWVAISLSRRSS